jgi:hypothetical protein
MSAAPATTGETTESTSRVMTGEEIPVVFQRDEDGNQIRKFKARDQVGVVSESTYIEAEKYLRKKYDELAPYALGRLWSVEQPSRYHVLEDPEVMDLAKRELCDDTLTADELEDILISESDVPKRLGDLVAKKIEEKNITNVDDEKVDNYVRAKVLDGADTPSDIRKLAFENRSSFYFLTSANYTDEASDEIRRILRDLNRGKSLDSVVLDNFKLMDRLGNKVERKRARDKKKGN